MTDYVASFKNAWGECPKCKKSKRNWLSFVFILLGTWGVGMTAGLLFLIGAFWLNLGTEEFLAKFAKLPFMFGATAYLWWITFNFEKLVCECE